MKTKLTFVVLSFMTVLTFMSSCSSSGRLACPSFKPNGNEPNAYVKSTNGKKTAVRKRVSANTTAQTTPKAGADIANNENNTLPPIIPQDTPAPLPLFADANNQPLEFLAKPAHTTAPTNGNTNEPVATKPLKASSGSPNKPKHVLQKIRNSPLLLAAMAAQPKQAVSTLNINNDEPKPNDTAKADKLALVGGILGIVSLVIPYFGLATAIAALVLCSIALDKGTKRKGLAIAGLVCAGVFILALLALLVFYAWLFALL